MKTWLTLLLVLTLFSGVASAVEWSPQGNITLKNRYYILNDPIDNCPTGYLIQGKLDNGSWNCTSGGAGDITGVTTAGDYLTGGCLTATCDLLVNGTELNATIDARETDTTYTNSTGLSLVGTTFSILAGYIEGLFLQLTGGTMAGDIDMDGNIIKNIGNAGTDFDSSGGLTLASDLQMNSYIQTNGNDIYMQNTGIIRYVSEILGASTGTDLHIKANDSSSVTVNYNRDAEFSVRSDKADSSSTPRFTVRTGADVVDVDLTDSELDLNTNIIKNIGNAGTDFDSSGGLTLADNLTVNGKTFFESTVYKDGAAGSSHVTEWFEDSTRVAQLKAEYNYDQLLWSLGSGIGLQLVLGAPANRNKDYDHAAQNNPTLFIHSAIDPDTANTQWISFTHNQVDGVIDVGTGNVKLADNLDMVGNDIINVNDVIGISGSNLNIQANDSADVVINHNRDADFIIKSDNLAGATTTRFTLNTGADVAEIDIQNTVLDMNSKLIKNIGASGTDFTASGGLELSDSLVITENTPGITFEDQTTGQTWFFNVDANDDFYLRDADAPHTYWSARNGTTHFDLYADLDVNGKSIVGIGAGGTYFNSTGSLEMGSAINTSGYDISMGYDGDLKNVDQILGSPTKTDLHIRANDSGSLTLNYNRDAAFSVRSDDASGVTQSRFNVQTGADVVDIDVLLSQLDMNDNIIKNIGDSGTDFSATGGLTLADDLVCSAEVGSHLIPATDNTYDLGNTTHEWRSLYIDATAYIDTIDAGNVVFPNDAIPEADLDFDTACASGNHLYVNGNDLACEADDDNPEAGDVTWSDLTDEGVHTDTKYCTYASGTGFISCNSTGGNGSTYYAGPGLDLNGSDYFSILVAYRLPQGCGDGEIAEWNNTDNDWDCGVDNTAAAGMAEWKLAVIDTGGTESITDAETVTLSDDSKYFNITRVTNVVTFSFNETELNATIDDRDANANLTEEEIEDFVGGMLGGTEDGIDVTYQDGTNDIDFEFDCSDVSGDGTACSGEDLIFDCSDVADTGLVCSGEDLQVNTTYLDDNYLPLPGGTMSGNVDMDNNTILNIGDSGTDFTGTGGLNLAGNFTCDGYVGSDLRPEVDDTKDLGDGTHEWRNIWIDGTANIDTIVLPNDAISEAEIDMDTACASGNHLYVSGNDFACEADANANLTEEEVEDFVGGMLGGTETHISVDYQDGTNDIDFVVSDDWWDADADIAADEIGEGKIAFSTACAAGNHYYLNGNDLACEADDDTTYVNGTGLDLNGSNYFSVLLAYQMPQGCDDGELPEWNDTDKDWDCATDDGGSGGNTTEQMQDAVMAAIDDGTQTHITVTYQDGTDDMDFVVSDDWWDSCEDMYECGWWDEDGDIDDDEISEAKINFVTDCDAGNHLYVNGNDLACEADANGNLTEEEVEDFVGGMLGGTETFISVDYQDGTNDIDFVVSDSWWNADGDIAADTISEGKIIFSTACAAGNHFYLNGNDLACEPDAGGTPLTEEEVYDFCGAMATSGDGVDFTHNDAANTTTPTFDCSDVDGTGLGCSGEDLQLDWTEVASDAVAEAKIDFDTACAAGAYYEISGNDLACTVPDIIYDTTPQLGGNLDANGNDIEVDSSDKVCLNGAACTKYIYYDGSNVIIQG